MKPLNYNLELLKADGSHYVAIGFSAPFCLHLPDGNYEVIVSTENQDIVVQIVLERRNRNLSKGGLLPGIQEIEKFADRHGIYCFTSAIVYIPVRGHSPQFHEQINEMSRIVEAKHSWFNQLSVEAFNRLVEVYRFYTGECHINPLHGRDVWMDYSFAFFFNELPPDEGKSKFTAHVTPVYSLHSIIPSAPDVPKAVVQDIQSKLRIEFQTNLADELLLNAHDFIDQGNFRLAIIEAETAFEAEILRFLHLQYQGRQSDIDKIERINSFTTLLKNDLFKNAIAKRSKKFEKNEKRYEKWNEQVWKIRGKLVHGNISNVTREEAVNALQTVEETLEYLVDRPQTRPWRYVR